MIPQMTVSCPPPSTSEREEQARALCLRLLTARSRTRAELAGQLAKRGYPEDIGNRVLDRLAAVGLVDDTDFAEQWVQSRRANAAKSKRALAAELHAKGVDDDVITTVLVGATPVPADTSWDQASIVGVAASVAKSTAMPFRRQRPTSDIIRIESRP